MTYSPVTHGQDVSASGHPNAYYKRERQAETELVSEGRLVRASQRPRVLIPLGRKGSN